MDKHPIPHWLRDAFSTIENCAPSQNGMQVFTQMRTVVQSYFQSCPSPAESDKEAVRNAALEDSIVRGIAGAIKEGDGVWRSCTGCHELNEGHDTGAWSNVFKCHLGSGCRECGGIGAIWDDADYDAMADAMAKSMQDQPAQPSDTEMLDWLENHVVNVRAPLLHGSQDVFWASPDNDDPSMESLPSDIRDKIKAAMRAQVGS